MKAEAFSFNVYSNNKILEKVPVNSKLLEACKEVFDKLKAYSYSYETQSLHEMVHSEVKNFTLQSELINLPELIKGAAGIVADQKSDRELIGWVLTGILAVASVVYIIAIPALGFPMISIGSLSFAPNVLLPFAGLGFISPGIHSILLDDAKASSHAKKENFIQQLDQEIEKLEPGELDYQKIGVIKAALTHGLESKEVIQLIRQLIDMSGYEQGVNIPFDPENDQPPAYNPEILLAPVMNDGENDYGWVN